MEFKNLLELKIEFVEYTIEFENRVCERVWKIEFENWAGELRIELETWNMKSTLLHLRATVGYSSLVLYLFCGGGVSATSEGSLSSICSEKIYLSQSIGLAMLWCCLSNFMRWARIDSAPCSPIRPDPMCHHGMMWSSMMCIFRSMVASGNVCR